ncbi:MAG: ACT domain-containing protein, partial [Nitrosopumilaceae archaeon]
EQSVLKNARLSLTDGILDVSFSLDEIGEQETMNLMNKFSELKSDYEFFRLTDSFRLLTEDLVDVRQLIESFPGVKNFFNTGLAKIKIRIPQDQNRSDVVSYVAEILHSNGIELINAYFSQDDIVVALNEKDASRAYELLRADISR